MTILEQSVSSHRKFVRPPSVQPGGGFCMGLELAWGRLRRAFLRRFRPGYVADMARKREGICADCPHDIIDPRDLKFWRNVCGYWFRDEDDAFRWRGRLRLARAGLAEVVFFSLLFLAISLGLSALAILVHWGFWIALVAVLVLWFEAVFFFRDPERTIPLDPSALVSPADGTVTHVEEVEDADFPGGRALRISIFLSVFNVHVNRVPRAGQVVGLRYYPGCFRDARSPECPVQNEQLWIDLQEPDSGRLIRVKQISGAVARRIVCWLKIDETVVAGARFGMIKFGSRTDVLLTASESVNILTSVGDRVRGGNTVLLRFR
jgi:phosphatidylserine decarboxylase